MSTKAKLRLRHIEDADKSKAAAEPAAPKLVATAAPVPDPKKSKSLKDEPVLTHEGESSSAVGTVLRRGREEKDLSLQDVAQQLRIQRSYLQALETGDFDNLPGLTYAIGYVRSYSQLVGLDAEKLITDFKAEAKKLQEPTQLSFPSPAPEGKVPGGALMFVGVLLAALSYGGWYYFSTSETSVSDLTPTIPDRLAFLLEEPAIESGTGTPATQSAETAPAPNAAFQAEPAPATMAKNTQAPAPAAEAPAATAATDTADSVEPVSEQVAAAPAEAPLAAETSSADVAAAAPVPAPQQQEPVTTAAAPVPDVPAVPESEVASVVTETEPAPVETAAEAPAPASVPTEAPATEVASAPAAADLPAAAEIPAVPEVSRSAPEPSAVNAEAAAIDSKPAPAPTASSEGPKIVISATDDSWVQVRGSDAAPLLTRILRKGEQYEVPVRSGLRLFTGNAGALKISVNGAEAPSLGPFGKIARNVPLDESLLTYTVSD